ncbi:hypothetical protein Tco_1458415 [Tanacetum coccineum]
MDISTTPYVQIYTHLKAYEPHAKKTLKKQEQSTSIVDPLAYVAHTTSALCSFITLTHNANLLSGFQKQFPIPQQPVRDFSTTRLHLNVHDWSHCTESVIGRLQTLITQDKALLMEAKEKGDVLDAEAEAFLADVECTAPYAFNLRH